MTGWDECKFLIEEECRREFVEVMERDQSGEEHIVGGATCFVDEEFRVCSGGWRKREIAV